MDRAEPILSIGGGRGPAQLLVSPPIEFTIYLISNLFKINRPVYYNKLIQGESCRKITMELFQTAFIIFCISFKP